jgi:hypothetical protein
MATSAPKSHLQNEGRHCEEPTNPKMKERDSYIYESRSLHFTDGARRISRKLFRFPTLRLFFRWLFLETRQGLGLIRKYLEYPVQL